MHRAIVATWTAKPGAEDRVQGVLTQLAADSRREPGCLAYVVHQAADNKAQFLLYEVYRDADAVAAHGESRHFKRYVLGEAAELLMSHNRVELDSLSDGGLFC